LYINSIYLDMKNPFCFFLFMVCAALVSADPITIGLADRAQAFTPLPFKTGGRVALEQKNDARTYRFQWPGIYFECACNGTAIAFDLGAGKVIYHVIVDGRLQPPLVKPAPGRYLISGLPPGDHDVRIEAVTESAAPNEFGGFFAGPHTKAARLAREAARARQIEFIGDSYAAGYGNLSPTRECTPEQVWERTDTSSSFPVLVAKHYNADYQVNAISGRGIVRNYDGFVGSTVPEAYPYTLFDKTVRWNDPRWNPQIIWIDLGSNDFATPLHPTEKWKTPAELHTDFQNTYIAFVKRLRARQPRAYIILSASGKEFADEVTGVVAKLNAEGEKHIGYMLFPDLQLTGCNWHLTIQDNQKLLGMMMDYIDHEIGQDW